ncbi:MAG: squalene/phytoene synthase family protein [Eggerthella lenta]
MPSFDLDAQPFFDMLEGQRRDLSFRQPKTMGDLEEYGYYVAGSVGLLLPILHAALRWTTVCATARMLAWPCS